MKRALLLAAVAAAGLSWHPPAYAQRACADGSACSSAGGQAQRRQATQRERVQQRQVAQSQPAQQQAQPQSWQTFSSGVDVAKGVQATGEVAGSVRQAAGRTVGRVGVAPGSANDAHHAARGDDALPRRQPGIGSRGVRGVGIATDVSNLATGDTSQQIEAFGSLASNARVLGGAGAAGNIASSATRAMQDTVTDPRTGQSRPANGFDRASAVAETVTVTATSGAGYIMGGRPGADVGAEISKFGTTIAREVVAPLGYPASEAAGTAYGDWSWNRRQHELQMRRERPVQVQPTPSPTTGSRNSGDAGSPQPHARPTPSPQSSGTGSHSFDVEAAVRDKTANAGFQFDTHHARMQAGHLGGLAAQGRNTAAANETATRNASATGMAGIAGAAGTAASAVTANAAAARASRSAQPAGGNGQSSHTATPAGGSVTPSHRALPAGGGGASARPVEPPPRPPQDGCGGCWCGGCERSRAVSPY